MHSLRRAGALDAIDQELGPVLYAIRLTARFPARPFDTANADVFSLGRLPEVSPWVRGYICRDARKWRLKMPLLSGMRNFPLHRLYSDGLAPRAGQHGR